MSARRYPARCALFARRLHAERGYSLARIADAVARQGFPRPSTDTVRKWVDEDALERRRAHDREYRREKTRRDRDARLDETMAELRRKGLSCQAVAIAVGHFEGVEIGGERVRYRTRKFGPFGRTAGATTQRSVPKRNFEVRRLSGDEKAQTLELVRAGLSDREIGERLGLTRQAVGVRRRNLLRELADGRTWTEVAA